MTRKITPINYLEGEITIPGSKSHTIRGIFIALLSKGRSYLYNPLESADTLAARNALKALGGKIEEQENLWIIDGIGTKDLKSCHINVLNSGTTLYIAVAIAALTEESISFDGDSSIRKRSAENLLHALEDLGVEIERSNGECVPFTIKGSLNTGSISLKAPTSQYLTALLLATPLASTEKIEIDLPLLYERPYIDMTMEWLKEQHIKIDTDKPYEKYTVYGNQSYEPFKKSIAGDYSSATFFLCAAAITQSKITLKNLFKDDPQGDKAILKILAEMGCEITRESANQITITGKPLRGLRVDLNNIPDSLPALSVLACYAEGETIIYNVENARIKETDRIKAMYTELSKLGANIKEQQDGLIIQGGKPLQGGTIHSYHDHRIIMAFAIGALKAKGEIIIDDTSAVEVTFPSFFKELEKLSR